MNKKIDEILAYIAKDPSDGTEGIISVISESGPLPMVGADREKMLFHRPLALEIAKKKGIKVTLLRFSKREELEVL